jgi:hypothetical protein
VLARAGLGLAYPRVGPHILEEARAVAAIAEPPGHRPILLASAYLRDGKAMGDENKGTMAKIGDCASAQGPGHLLLVGGDFQCGPHVMEEGGFPERVRGKVVAAPSARGTFRGGGAASTLDYFVVEGTLANAIHKVSLVEGTGIKGHVPVAMEFCPRPVALKALTIRRPPDLGMEPVFGPRPPPADWTAARDAAAEALHAATHGASEETVQRRLDSAYGAWCRSAEEEVADATGTTPAKWGLRGLHPRVKWSSVLPEVKPKGGPSTVAVATWLRGYAQELLRATEVLESVMGAGLFIDPWPAGSNRPHGATFCTPVRGGTGPRPSGTRRAAAPEEGGPKYVRQWQSAVR